MKNYIFLCFMAFVIVLTLGGCITADPTFNPPQGTYSTDQAISLSCGTSGASIYYTTDGVTTPTATSTPYTDPIEVTGPNNITTIMAIAVKEGLTQSSVVSATYTVRYQYTLTINSLTGGTTSPAGTVTVNHGEATSITATPNTGYSFVTWSVISGTGVTFSDVNSASTTVTLTGGDATIQANFNPLVTDVYVAGGQEASNYKYVATIWKNGAATALTDGTQGAYAESIFVTGSDVYIAGPESNGSYSVAKVWKNGTAISLTDGTQNAYAFSVFVTGSDVYIAGYETNVNDVTVAKVWKNGTATALTDGTHSAAPYSVFVSGNDVYVAGVEKNVNNYSMAKVWKNGTATALTDGTHSAFATSVFVSGNDVYIAGYEYSGTNGNGVAKLWKNGMVISLTDGTQNAHANSVFVIGSDVYVAGDESNGSYSVAKVWKNGTATALTDGTHNAGASSLFVSGNDVYVAGLERNMIGVAVAKVWKNGTATTLTDGTKDAGASSVFVIVY